MIPRFIFVLEGVQRGLLPTEMRQAEMAERELMLEGQPAAVDADDASGNGDLREVDDVSNSVVRRFPHDQLTVEHAVAHAVEENALRGYIGGALRCGVIDRASCEIEIDVHTSQIARIQAPEAILLRCAAVRVVVFPGKMRVEHQLGVVVIVVVHLAGDDLGSCRCCRG